MTPSQPALPERAADWEAFYRDYRKPGYVSGFEITSKLGGGQFGLVFRARRQSIGKDYAIKFLKVEDSEVRRAVQNELEQVKYFAQIDHPNLVSIEDRGEVDGIPFLVMSFAGTETLKDRMLTDGVPPAPELRDQLVRWFLQACRGVGALHERSLVHFDIKPANVFLKGPVARIGDYGLSKLVTHSRGSLSMGRGTPYYMAPEMLQRRGDARSDIYSLGVVLYEILCGCVPFTGDSEWQVLRKHEQEGPAMPDHLSAPERAVLLRCLQKDPAARFQNVADLIEALGRTLALAELQNESVATPMLMAAAPAVVMPSCLPPPLPAVLPPPLRRPRRRSRLASLSVFCVLFGAVVWTVAEIESSRGRSSHRTVAVARTPAPGQPSAARSSGSRTAPDLGSRVDQFVASVEKNARLTAQRQQKVALRELAIDKLQAPADLEHYRELVEALADAPSFSAGHATKLERHGRPVFLAGVALLQDLDYDDSDDCRAGSNVLQMLAQMTAIEGLVVELPAGEPGCTEMCRVSAYADGWRRLAEQFAKSDADFRAVLVAKGKIRSKGGER